MFLITVDANSKWIDTQIVSNSTSYMTMHIEHLRTLFATHGIPEVLVTENGTPVFTIVLQISPGRMVFTMYEYHLTIPCLKGWLKGL